MKKLFAIIGIIGLLSFTVEKYVVVKFTEEQINYHWNNLNNVKQVVNNSNIPHQSALFIIQAVDSLQRDIQKQAQIDSTTQSKK